MRIPSAVAGALLLTVLAGCSAGDPDQPPQPPATAAAAAPSPSATPPPSTPAVSKSPAAKGGGLLKIGEHHLLDNEPYHIDSVVLAHRSGDGFEGVQVRTCNKGSEEIGVSRGPWSLGYDDFESLHDVDTIGGGLPAPAYPDLDERRLSKGKCVKGWINFTDIPGEKPVGIQYAPNGLDPVRWAF